MNEPTGMVMNFSQTLVVAGRNPEKFTHAQLACLVQEAADEILFLRETLADLISLGKETIH